MSDKPKQVYDVVVFGVSGSGKSSIINLLTDKPVADVSTDGEPCTKRPRWYPITLGEKKLRLWDTMGFRDAEAKDIVPLSPYEQAYSLLRNLDDGVALILLCAHRDQVNESLRKLYWLLDSFSFGGRAQIALVFTHFDEPHKEWWSQNKNAIARMCNIPVQFLPRACITAIQDGPPQSKSLRKQSKEVLQALLEEHATIPTPLRDNLSSDAACAAAAEGLNTYCQLSNSDATTLVDRFSSPKRPFHVILFGEAGAGKSSIINLIVGSPVAEISSDPSKSGTRGSHTYKVTTGLHQFLVWDTPGFNETSVGEVVRLIGNVPNNGGINLLVFCKKPGPVTLLEINSFARVQELFSENQVPIAFIITHLEARDPMEEWWEMNGESVPKALGMETSAMVGHACITSAPDNPNDQALRDKLSLSRESILAMLESLIPDSSHTSMPEEKEPLHIVEEENSWWFDERFGPDSCHCISLSILC